MDHDQGVCPRCGEPAGVHSFCQSCRSQMDSMAGISTSAAAHAADSVYPGTRALQEVLRLEEALAAASKGINERIAARTSAAVEVEPDPLAARANDIVDPAREVARLEDVLTVAPTALPEPPQVQVVEQVEPATRPEEHLVEPIFVAAAALREAFWFEQASAFKPEATSRPAPEPVALASCSVPPPAKSLDAVDPSLPDGDAEPSAEDAAEPSAHDAAKPSADDAASPSALELWIDRARINWPVALWLLALVALVALLSGRSRRHLI